MAFEFISSALAKRRTNSLYRQRQAVIPCDDGRIEINGQRYVNFASNDYLGLAQSTELKTAWQNAICQYPAGSGASPLVTGYTHAHHTLENHLADYLGREAVLLFNSGFAANQAVCQSLMAGDGVIIADKLSHASLIDGALASNGKLQRYVHNDLAHLQRLIVSPHDNKLVVTEGVFSMDGDAAPLTDISRLCTDNNAWLMVDDAHGFGVLGDKGMGSAELHDLSQSRLPILMATFGKAVGTAGAFVAGSQELIDYLLNTARHYIYSTHLPAAQAMATDASLTLIRSQVWRRHKLQENIGYFKTRAAQLGIPLMPSDSAIQPVMIGHPQRALSISQVLQQQGLWLSAIRQPTVPKGTDRLRITLTASHQQTMLEQLLISLARALNNAD
ncbi:8-amino-7-oxononanoate synthase [Neptunicella sp.]|uniref:8-amino-7-oxononanoate synthase n=1 Tax=Neptunicella sp. TaxID=2125986 RepID=UPI003F68E4BC